MDQPLPILGNRTPMDAVKDPDGREIVESLVIQAERFGRNPTSSTDEDVFRRLRERLGLAGSQSQLTKGLSTSSRATEFALARSCTGWRSSST
jgi:hypothetical protein